MVFVENKNTFLSKIEESNILKLFYCFLQNNSLQINLEDYQSQTDKDYASFIQALISNDKSSFTHLYNQFCKKKPSATSPWVNNDFLIFSLIVGVFRFDIDKRWIINVINTRNTQDVTQLKINTTLKNIISNNFASNDNLQGIVLVFQYLLYGNFSIDVTKSLYQRVTNDPELFSGKHDFYTCIALRAIEVIVDSKDFSNAKEIHDLKNFSELFLKRVDRISKFLRSSIILTASGLLIFYIWKYDETWGKIDIIGGVLGSGGLFSLWKVLYNILKKGLLKLLGYSQYFK
ncbi:hypothetical protein [Dysgonomonas sp. 520]|uniref:hypothetical protein n=1 Tax=Dysgonomonas sp. 520 TaxID=2302931 RepID=UPI0013D3371E|nr:hypothetical protein [Dysgonomonas sp. 520]NDW11080.1 hypothetical protein [Dysgonomonas sp. 520]